MISALTWLTSAESKIAELDSAVDAAEEHPDLTTLKEELKVCVNHNNCQVHQHSSKKLKQTVRTQLVNNLGTDLLKAISTIYKTSRSALSAYKDTTRSGVF